MNRSRLLPLLLLIAAPAGSAAADYVLIVHPSNPAATIAKADVGRLFLRTTTLWPGGEHVKPVDLVRGSAARVAFTKEVLGRSMAAIDQYWTQAVFSGRAIPPPEKRSDGDVVAYVKDTPGAIGYVSAAAATDGVKRVAVGN